MSKPMTRPAADPMPRSVFERVFGAQRNAADASAEGVWEAGIWEDVGLLRRDARREAVARA